MKAAPSEGFVSQSRELFRARPWLAPAAAALAVVASLLIPFSYQKTTGYDLAVALGASEAAKTQALAKHLSEDFGATSVSINSDGGELLVTGRIPADKARGLKGRVDALAAVLKEQGMTADVSVEPVVETVSGSLYAMTRDAVVKVDITATGRTPAEIEADVVRQLQAAGLNDAQVSVTQADGQTTVQIFAHGDGASATGGTGAHALPDGGGWVSSGGGSGEHPEFEFTIDGQSPGADKKMATVQIQPGDAPKSDAELEAELERQLAAQGFPSDVVVRDGKVQSVTRRDR
jgi:hypothetical protein